MQDRNECKQQDNNKEVLQTPTGVELKVYDNSEVASIQKNKKLSYRRETARQHTQCLSRLAN